MRRGFLKVSPLKLFLALNCALLLWNLLASISSSNAIMKRLQNFGKHVPDVEVRPHNQSVPSPAAPRNRRTQTAISKNVNNDPIENFDFRATMNELRKSNTSARTAGFETKKSIYNSLAKPTIKTKSKPALKKTTLKAISKGSAAVKRSRDVTTLKIPEPQTTQAKRSSPVSAMVATDDSNIYLQNLGNKAVYGHTNCSLNEHKSVYARIFQKWVEIANKENIVYFLTCGSLLGAYRNGDIIPYDYDMDILVDRNDFEKIKKHMTEKSFEYYTKDVVVYLQKDFYKAYEKRRRFDCSGKQVDSQMDFCSFQEPLGRLMSDVQYMDVYDFTRSGEVLDDFSDGGRTFRVEDVFPLRQCVFMEIKTVCPNNPEKFLSTLYKDLAPKIMCENGKWVASNKKAK